MNGVAKELEQRRRDLGMNRQVVAKRAGLGIATVQRALSTGRATLESLVKIAEALGTRVSTGGGRSVTEMRQEQATRKARRLVGLVQGTSALEAQAVGPRDVQEMVERTIIELLKGSHRRLWEE